MKAVVLNAPGGTEELEYQELPRPQIKAGEVLIKVKAISINPVDVKIRQGGGLYQMLAGAKPLVLGWDISGTVAESNSDLFTEGDHVFGMVNFPGHGQGYAEYVAAPAEQLARKPAEVSFENAAAATLVALTSWQALVSNAQIKPGQKILIHAAAGGVGHIAVQLAKHLGAEVTGTSSEKNREFVLNLGADSHIDYHHYDWSKSETEFDFVLDTIGGDNFEKSLAVTKPGGSIISIPTGLPEDVIGRAKEKGVNGYFILVKSNGGDMQQIASLLEKGIIKPLVSQTFSFDEIREAHAQIETGKTLGKVIIKL